MNKLILLIIISLSLLFCQKAKDKTKIVGTDWIIGNWENNSKEGNLIEIWKKRNDSIYDGQCYFIKEKDTLHSEKMELKQKGEKTYFIFRLSKVKTMINQYNSTIILKLKNNWFSKILKMIIPKKSFILESQILKF